MIPLFKPGSPGRVHPFQLDQLNKARETEINHTNPKFVLETYKHLARNGNAEAQYRYAMLASSSAEAITYLKSAAAQGHLMAQCELGEKYAYGDGVEKNEKKAITYFTEAATNAHPRARMNLGVMHYIGRGTEKNSGLGKLYLKQAEQQYLENSGTFGHDNSEDAFYVTDRAAKSLPAALYLLSKTYEKEDRSRAIQYVRQAANAGHPFIEFLNNGQNNTPAISKKYFAILEQVANEGCPDTFSLMQQILKGERVTLTKTDQLTLHYCKMAAEAGNTNAAFHAGKFYFETKHVDLAKTCLLKTVGDTNLTNAVRGEAAFMLFKIEDQRFVSYFDSSTALLHLKNAAKLGYIPALAHPIMISENTKEIAAATAKAEARQIN